MVGFLDTLRTAAQSVREWLFPILFPTIEQLFLFITIFSVSRMMPGS